LKGAILGPEVEVPHELERDQEQNPQVVGGSYSVPFTGKRPMRECLMAKAPAVVEKKQAPHKPSPLPSRSEDQASLFPPDDRSSRDSARQSLTRKGKRKLREQARKRYEEDWFAPAGSVEEKQLLKRWAKYGKVSHEDLQLIDKWLTDPAGIKIGRGILFIHAAKRKLFGEVVFETATERHKQLDDEEWLVAYFTAHGMKQREIAPRTHLSERRVDQIISDIKDRITKSFTAKLSPWDSHKSLAGFSVCSYHYSPACISLSSNSSLIGHKRRIPFKRFSASVPIRTQNQQQAARNA
jgi:hypothetical protein